MLNSLSIHVSDIDAAIWAIFELHRAKPVVSRCYEFGFFQSALSRSRFISCNGRYFFYMNQIASRVGNECTPRPLRPIGMTFINSQPGCSCEVSGNSSSTFYWAPYGSSYAPSCSYFSPWLVSAYPIYFCSGPIRGYRFFR